MARVPVSIVVNLNPINGWYRGRVVGWGVPAAGNYGSLFSLPLELSVTERATPREVLLDAHRALGVALGVDQDADLMPPV